MKTFLEFILERARTADQANKLGSYVAKRHSGGHLVKLIHDKKLSDHVYKKMVDHGAKHGDKYLHSTFDNVKTQKVKISDLQHTQGSVAWKHKEGKRKLKDNEPIEVVHYKGKHYIKNGHHRVFAHKLKGDTHIHAKVVHIGDDD